MAFSTQENDEVLSEINITPLVDVMLVLLVVFIVTAPLLTNAVRVNLPKTDVTAPIEQKKSISVSIKDDGSIFVDKDAVAAESLEANLRSAKADNPELVLHLQADEAVNYGIVARTMASIERAGISKLSVLTTAN